MHMITAKSHNQGFSLEKKFETPSTLEQQVLTRLQLSTIYSCFDIISVDRFASDALTCLVFEACGDKSAPEKRFKERDFERERERERERGEERRGGEIEKRERERERERERDLERATRGTCIKTRLCM